MRTLVIYVHGKGGSAAEAEAYRPQFPGAEVIGFDYRATTPWEAKREFSAYFEEKRRHCDTLILIANSIGAYFCMQAPGAGVVTRAYFISPVVDMERLILRMMRWADVREEDLREKGEIATGSGEVLSWEYLSYVRERPVIWDVPTKILYGGRDELVPREEIRAFAAHSGASVAVLPGGGHWFHTGEETDFLFRQIGEAENTCRGGV